MVGLWFKLGAQLAEAEEELCSLPTHKLLPLTQQMACRLGAPKSGADDFQPALRKVLLRAGKAHIHAVLPPLLALAYGDRYSVEEVAAEEDPNPNPNPNPSPNPSPNPNPNPNQVAAEDDVFDSAQVQPRIRRVAASGT